MVICHSVKCSAVRTVPTCGPDRGISENYDLHGELRFFVVETCVHWATLANWSPRIAKVWEVGMVAVGLIGRGYLVHKVD